jgi:HSP20 family molecular chaperone IbpA
MVELPTTVDADRVTATLKNGMLELTMPKAARSKAIEIRPKAA